jgi:hypothetical protein
VCANDTSANDTSANDTSANDTSADDTCGDVNIQFKSVLFTLWQQYSLG